MALYDKGTDYEFFIHEKFANVPRSKFDLSRLNSFTFDVGELRVADFFETLPGDDFELNCQWLLESLPLAVRPMNRFTIMVDYYYIEKRKLWKGWKTYITKGRSGNIEIPLPMINIDAPICQTPDGSGVIYDTCESLAQDLGIPAYSYNNTHYLNYRSEDSSTYTLTGRNPVKQACALPFFFYHSIFKYYELNQNLVQDNPHWFPKYGDDYWILPESYGRATRRPSSGQTWSEFSADDVSPCELGIYLADDFYDSGDDELDWLSYSFASPVPTARSFTAPTSTVASKPDVVSLLQTRYAQFRADGFTTSLPWLMRGSVPTTTLESSEFSAIFEQAGFQLPDGTVYKNIETETDSNGVLSSHVYPSYEGLVGSYKGKISLSAQLDAQRLRSMLALTAWQERNGYTNGSYNKMIETHFREDPNAETYAPIHIGGFSSDIYFSDVIQNVPTADSPAGTQTSNALSQSSGFIGRFHSHDYGYIMAIVKVIPDTMYVDGLDHIWTKSKQQDEYFPEFANLSPEPITNQEIFVSDTDNVNKDLFGYQDRYWYLKTRSNRVGGLFSLPSTSDSLFSAYSQARQFTSLPKLSNQFVTASPENVRRDMLAYQNEPFFKFQFASRVSAVRPLPYKSIPNTFGF